MYFELTDRFLVAADIAKTWEFFTRTENLTSITPPWLGFQVRTAAPVEVGPDAVLDYTVRWAGVPLPWRSRIIDFSPPRQFIDLQVRGPYTLWHHQHAFTEAAGGTGTECYDRVIYRLPVPLLATIVHAAVVRRQLVDIFRHRRSVIGQRLGWVKSLQEDVAIARL